MILNSLYASILDKAVNQVVKVLNEFADSPVFAEKFTAVFGTSISAQQFRSILTGLPKIEVRSDNELQGALGAFSGQTGKIYLSQSLVSGDKTRLEAVLIEEIGHFVDAQVNKVDSSGDEGELFSDLVRGVNLSQSELTRIQTEDDHAVINLGGQFISVEQATPIILTVTTTFDQYDGSATNGLSLREAIGIANANTTNDYIIQLQGGVTYNLTRSDSSITNDSQGLYDLDIIGGANVTIESVGTGKAIINGEAIRDFLNSNIRILDVFQDGELTLNNVILTKGQGGTIRVNNGGLLYLNNSLISNSSTTNFYSTVSALENYGTSIINNSEIKNNRSSNAGDSGAIFNKGVLEINSSVISNNSTGSSGDGGGINNDGGTVYLIDSSVSNNTANSKGGGIYNDNGSFKIINSIIENNISGFSGGAIYNSGSFGNTKTLDLINSVVQGNRNNTSLGSSSSSGAIDNRSTMNISQGSQIINNIGNGIYNEMEFITNMK